MKEYKLINESGKILLAKAFEIDKDIFVIGKRVNKTKLNCHTIPLTKEAIEKLYSLKLIEANK